MKLILYLMNMTGLKNIFYMKNSLNISLWTTIYLIPGGRKMKLFSPTLKKLAKNMQCFWKFSKFKHKRNRFYRLSQTGKAYYSQHIKFNICITDLPL